MSSLVSFRSVSGASQIHLKIAAIKCFCITKNPYSDAVFPWFVWHIYFECTSSSECNQLFINGAIWRCSVLNFTVACENVHDLPEWCQTIKLLSCFSFIHVFKAD